MDKNQQTIKCTVRGCKYNEDDDHCTLEEILVDNNNVTHASDKQETLCDSYENKED